MSAVDLVLQIPFNDMNYFILFEKNKDIDWQKHDQSLDEAQNEALVSRSLLMWHCWSNSCNACVLYHYIFDVLLYIWCEWIA